MKKLFILCIAVLATATLWAQSPQQISYQTVIRNAEGKLVENKAIGLRISILKITEVSTIIYAETHTPTTNSNGLVSLAFGNGADNTGDFSNINWANGPYSIKTEVDPEGGTSYTINGTTQLASVPYALHAKTAANGLSTDQAVAITANTAKVGLTPEQTTVLKNTSGTNTGNQDGSETKIEPGTNVTVTGSGTSESPYVVNAISSSGTYYLGQEKDEGIIYYLYTGSDGNQHGLIVSKTEISTTKWQTSNSITGADRTEDGVYNTERMTNSPAADYVTNLGTGWYLPSIDELGLLYYNRFHVNKALRDGGYTLITNGFYWSSTENFTEAYLFRNYNGDIATVGKSGSYSVRAVRAF